MLRITLLKAATHPDHSQDQGEHVFTYALYPHRGSFVEGGVVQEAAALNVPLSVKTGKVSLPFESFLSFDRECVELDAVKKTEDGRYVAVRFHDFTGGTNRIGVRTGFDWKKYCVSDLRERPLGDWEQTREIILKLKP